MLGPVPVSHTQPEVVVLRFRRHGRRLVLPVVVMIAIAGAAGYWVGALPSAWMNLTAGAGAALLGVLLGIVPVLSWLARRTTVTTRRVIARRGILVHQRTELPLSRVREVRARRGPLQRLWGAGDIELHHGSESMRIEDAPGVVRITEALNDLMERNYAQEARQLRTERAQHTSFNDLV